ncbi:MAG: tRNA dihydrouridine(20/20a) synthase DusA [Pseudomonadota bacterium]
MTASVHAHRFCVAPMMDGTDRHCRYFHRLMSRHARLYTEMVTADAVAHGDRDYLLGFCDEEHPVALQLGGSDPATLAQAASIGADHGYDEINLNVGCPSDRVQSGAFGACLMKTPTLVADCVAAMRATSAVPITVKCRLGVDDQDPAQTLFPFIETVANAGCHLFIIHARKAWLQGLSPKENRTVPPLDYDVVRAVKTHFANLTIILNGGLETVGHAHSEMTKALNPASTDENGNEQTGLDGVMLGRAPYANPWLLSEVDPFFFSSPPAAASRQEVVHRMQDYVDRMVRDNTVKPHAITRHMLGLFNGQRGARHWRQALSRHGRNTPPDILTTTLVTMPPAAEPAAPSARTALA